MIVDLRIVVLQRGAEDVIASTERRGFGGEMEYRILVENANTLHTELNMLDLALYMCVNYEQLKHFSSAKSASALSLQTLRIQPLSHH